MQETEKITYRTGTIAPPPEYEPVTTGTDERFKQYVTKSEQPQEPVSEEERRDAEEYFESRGENGDGADNTAWHNSTRNIVTNIGYLIGVRRELFDRDFALGDPEAFDVLERNRDAKIIRELCRIRCAIERYFGPINRAMRFEYKTIMNLPQYVPTDAIMYLSSVGINIVRGSNRMLYEYVIDINGYISDRINNCSKLFPIWLNWQYVRDLFVMPNGRTQEGTRAAAEAYYSNRMNYPYQSYINWKVEPDQGNILLNDKKFVTLLYKQHHDNFTDLSKVTDAGEKIKNSIYDFVADAKKVVLVVDCENSDPYKLTATLNNLDTDEIAKISKIILYNDVHASTAWGLLTNYAKGIEVEHIMTERVKDNKSLVDIRLSTGVCREFFANGVDSFMLVSSDSDYWGLIESLPDARFLVMLERGKSSFDIKQALSSREIFYCYIDDFCTGNSGDIKMAALIGEIKKYIAAKVNLNVNVMLDEVYRSTRVRMTSAEEKQFYQKYIKPMHLVIEDDGNVRIELRSK